MSVTLHIMRYCETWNRQTLCTLRTIYAINVPFRECLLASHSICESNKLIENEENNSRLKDFTLTLNDLTWYCHELKVRLRSGPKCRHQEAEETIYKSVYLIAETVRQIRNGYGEVAIGNEKGSPRKLDHRGGYVKRQRGKRDPFASS